MGTNKMVVAAAVLLVAGVAQADVFNMGGTRNPMTGEWTGLASVETVFVGDPGNAADTVAHSGNPAGQGSVAYTYNIGTYEVTAGQYTAFLNAVAMTDAYALYNTKMSDTSSGSGITRSGSAGTYAYAVNSNFANRPVNYVSWGDAARFANWLSNGQPTTGVQNASTTETGVYTLNGATTAAQLMAVSVPSAATRATWASGTTSKWLLTSEDEWYKGAYYKGGSTNAGYWDCPTRSNTGPGNNLADPSGNNANYYTGAGSYPIDSGKYTTVVGEFQNSPSPYGTFDQGGNVFEWNEANLYGSYRGMRGGSFITYGDSYLLAPERQYNDPSNEIDKIGFRVVQVPEPASIALLALGGVAILRRRRSRAVLPAVLAVILGLSGLASADTPAPWPTNWNNWNDPALWCTVGDPGNATDTTGYGAVVYTYKIGKFEVTAGQYTAFLNAVAATDTCALYNTKMWSDKYGCNIQQTGSSGSYTYIVASDYANRPVNFVSWGDAARFANWLTNGQPTGAQSLSTTENGSYYLNGATSETALMTVTRAANAKYVIPTENEWYKAAYYKGGSTNAGYWDYPTQSNTAPGRDMTDSSGNNANYDRLSGEPPIDSGEYVTTVVGEFQNSPGPYGTFDQGGNVWELDETNVGGARGLRGGSFGAAYFDLQAEYRIPGSPTREGYGWGFRIAEVPEPTSMVLLALGGLAVLRRRR
ncbi:MAG: SUMF1/EgtB/PvdO family nonheme iron enzyme [Planctomycetota bacterium]|nr:SUMF1/EgtB/PvdO family nonheme iron enzyme [Planctomycetota bacterium]